MSSLQDGALYSIINVKSGTALDLSGTDYRSVLGWNKHGGDNQKWKVIAHNGRWQIRNVATGKYLGLASQARDGVSVVGAEHAAEWEIQNGFTGQSNELRVLAPGTTFTLDLAGFGDATNGTAVKVWGGPGDFQTNPKRNQIWRFERVSGWSKHGGDNQKWGLLKVREGWYIQNIGKKEKFLGIVGTAKDNVAVIGQEVGQPFAWELTNAGLLREDQVRIVVPGTPFTVDLADFGSNKDGTLVKVWGRPGNDADMKVKDNQIWIFEKGTLNTTSLSQIHPSVNSTHNMVNLQNGQVYYIRNQQSGTVLDLSGTDWYNVSGWAKHGGENQRWRVIEENGLWVIQNIAQQRKFLAPASSPRDDVSVVGAENQPFHWELTNEGLLRDDQIRIVAPRSPFTLDLGDFGSDRDGAPVKLWGRPGSDADMKVKDNQIWIFEQA